MLRLQTAGHTDLVRVHARIMTPCLCTNLRMAARRLSAVYDEALAPFGINIGQYFLLSTLMKHPSVSLTELGDLAELDRSTIGRNILVLRRAGLVETTRSESDGREALITLSDDGRKLLQDAEPLWTACQENISDRLGRGRVETLRDTLARI